MTDIGTLGGGWSHAVAVTPSGDVVGNSATASGNIHAFRWHSGAITDLGTLGGGTSSARAGNGNGLVVGSSERANGETHAFVWSTGHMTDLGTLGGTCSSASAINGRGQVVGVAGTARVNDANPCGERHPFLWQKGVITDLNVPFERPNDPFFHPEWTVVINGQGTVSGSYTRIGDSGSQGAAGTLFRWTGGGIRLSGPLSPSTMAVTAQNSRGDVTGVLTDCCDDEHRSRGIVWIGDTVTRLEANPHTYAVGISGSGVVAGYDATFRAPTGTGTAFVWSAGIRTNLGSPGDGAQAAAISPSGAVVGAIPDTSGTPHAVLWRH
jgi:probable HAF family extracellular repeat protein